MHVNLVNLLKQICLPFHINSTEHSIITQAASQWVLCFSGSLPIVLIYLRLIIFFVLFSENKYDGDMAKINFAWNSVFWKTFKVNDVNIISDIIVFAGRLPWTWGVINL